MINSTREKLAKVLSVKLGEFLIPGAPFDEAVEDIITALPGMVELEWETANETIYWCNTVYGRYTYWETLDGEGYVGFPEMYGGVPVNGKGDDAKAAAQDHYSKQIMKALGL